MTSLCSCELIAVGPRWRNCGASDEQKQLGTEQMDFYKNLSDAFNTAFPGQQSILSSLTSSFSPILEAGPNQFGLSPAEETAQRTAASDAVTNSFEKSEQALRNNAASAGGGDAFLPSGAEAQLEAANTEKAAETGARAQNEITQRGYDIGRENYFEAAKGLGSVASEENPIGFGSAATGAGTSAGNTEAAITAANDAWMQPAFGLLGGAAGAALGNPAIFGGSRNSGGNPG